MVCTDFETTVCAAHYDAKVSASKVQATADSKQIKAETKAGVES